MVGEPCEFAVDKDGKEVGPGVCVAEMCSHATPDGPMQYECVMCRPPKDEPNGAAGAGAGGEGGADPVGPSGGTGGADPVKPPVAGSATGGSGTAGSNNGIAGFHNGIAGAPTNNNQDSNTDGGCSVAHGARGTAVTLVGLGLALGLVLRRRRSSNKGG
jgi:hypothetical protein